MRSLIPWKNRDGGLAEQAPLSAFRTEMDRLFDNFFREPFGALDWPTGTGSWMPAVDVTEDGNEVVVHAEMPGVDLKEIDISVTGNELTIKGEKKESSERKERDQYFSEIRFGAFRRTISLPQGVDTHDVDAKYANGVLTLRLKKSPEAAPKRIEVKTT